MKNSSQTKHFPWFEITILVAVMVVYGYAAFSDAYNFPNRWFTRDDSYYYFKVAQNISEGRGSTFDGINPTNGYHPLWTLVNIPIFALARFDLILPLRILLLVQAGLRVATSLFLYRLLDRTFSRPAAVLATLYWAFNYPTHTLAYQQGLETALTAFNLVLFLFLLHRFNRERKTAPVKWTQIAALGAVGVLLTFSRLDLVFLVAIFGLWIVFRDTPMRYLLPIDILILSTSALSGYLFRIGLPDYYLYANTAIITLFASLVVRLLLFYFLGLYEHPAERSPIYLLRQAALATTISSALIFVFLFTFTTAQGLSFPRTAPLIDGVLSFFLVVASRLGIRLFSRRDVIRKNISPLEKLKLTWRIWLRDGLTYYGIFGGALGLYMLWSKLTFGTASPVSGQIKRWWGSFIGSRVYGGPARSPAAFFGVEAGTDFNAWPFITNILGRWNEQIPGRMIPIPFELRYWTMLGLVVLTLFLLLNLNHRRTARTTLELGLIPLLAGSGAQVLSYNATGYAALKEWYWVSQLVFLVLFFSLLFDLLIRPLRRIPTTRFLLGLAIIYFGVSTAFQFSRIIIRQMPFGMRPEKPYMEVVDFVEQHTDPGSLIGMTGGGNVGYYIQDRTIINMDGLINSYAYFQAHQERRGSEYLAEMGMNYIFANPDILEGLPYRGQYTGRYEILDYFGGKAILRFDMQGNHQ